MDICLQIYQIVSKLKMYTRAIYDQWSHRGRHDYLATILKIMTLWLSFKVEQVLQMNKDSKILTSTVCCYYPCN